MAFSVQAIRKAGGFNENIGRIGNSLLLSNEEIEVQDHIRDLGFDIWYAANASVRHQVLPDRLRRNWF